MSNNPEEQPPERDEEEKPTEQPPQEKPPLTAEIGLRIRHPNQEENDSD